MERLTETNNCIGFMETYLNVDCGKCQYKNTGECEEFKDECRAVADFKIFVKSMYSKLKEYEDLEEQGKLLRLPCEIGDILYILTDDSPTRFEETKCQSIVFYSKNNFVVYAPCQYDDWGNAKWKLKRKDFGKTVFLTRQEAEQALKEMEGKRNENV